MGENLTALQLPTTLSCYNSISCHLYPYQSKLSDYLKDMLETSKLLTIHLHGYLCSKVVAFIVVLLFIYTSPIHLHSYAYTPRQVVT